MKTIGWTLSIILVSLPIHANMISNQPQYGNLYSNDGLNRFQQQIEIENQKKMERLKNMNSDLSNPYQSQNIKKLVKNR